MEIALGGLELSTVRVEQRHVQFDLTLAMAEVNGALVGTWKYSAALFEPEVMDRLAEHFCTLLEGVASHPHRTLRQLPLLSEEERAVLTQPTQRWPAQPEPTVLHRRFEGSAKRSPGAVAVSLGAAQWSYRELDERSNRLARHLGAAGRGPGRPRGPVGRAFAGVCCRRTGHPQGGGGLRPHGPGLPGRSREVHAGRQRGPRADRRR